MEQYPSSSPEAGPSGNQESNHSRESSGGHDSDDDDDDEATGQASEGRSSDSKGSEDRSDDEGDTEASDESRNSREEWSLFSEADKADENVPEDELADDEKKLVADEYVEGRHDEVREELASVPADSPEEAEVLANAALLENISAKLNEGNVPTDETLNEAVAETADELGIEIPPDGLDDVPPEASETTVPGDSTEAMTVPEVAVNDETLDDETTPGPTALQTTNPNTQTNPPNPNQNTNTQNPNINQPNPNPNVNPPNPNPNNPPPPGPPPNRRRGGGGGGWYPPYGPPFGNTNWGNQNAGSAQVSPNVYVAPPDNRSNRRRRAQAFLLGGVLGYIIGRRGGRIRTEKKLLPIQQKLEKQVNDLQTNIALREEKIRKLVREQAVVQPALAEQIMRRLENRKENPKTKLVAETKSKILSRDAEASADKKDVLLTTEEHMESIESTKADEVGHFAIITEKTPGALFSEEALRDSVEVVEKVAPILKVPERPKTIEAMTLAELLLIAERIPIERSNARKLFEANRLDDKGLRRVAEAFLRGERYEKILKDNLHSHDTVKLDKEEANLESNTEKPDQSANRTTVPIVNATVGPQQSTDSSKIESMSSAAPLSPKNSKPDQSATAPRTITKIAPMAAVIIIALLLLFLLLRWH